MMLIYTLKKTGQVAFCILLSVLFISTAINKVHAQVSVTDSLALVAIYNSTNGPSWANKANWLTANPVESWNGVTVFAGNVIGLTLNGNNLNGILPAEIGDLSEIQFMYLIGNQLTGPIPAELGSLTNLREFVAFANGFNGSLPATLGGLSQIQTFQVNSNQLSGSIPSSLAGSPTMITLNLSNNQLTGAIPQEFEDAGSLVQLDLSENGLTGSVPGVLSRASNLETLLLNDNQLTGQIPFELGDLMNLQALAMQNNMITGELPAQLGNLGNLLVMYLDNNFIGGSIPSSFGNLSNLFFLFLNNNELGGEIPATLGNLSNLRSLYLHDNGLIGKIPASFGNLTSLRELWLNNNSLDGNVPLEFQGMTSIESILIDNNKITGPVPAEIASLSTLKYLSLVNNDIDGLPDMSQMPALISLLVQGNELTFEDLEPNIGAPSSNFIYAPQQEVYTPYTEAVIIGNSFEIESAINGTANEYVWMLEGSEMASETNPTFSVGSADFSDEGVYTAKVTSPLVPGLEIYRSAVTVEISNSLPIELLEFSATMKDDVVILDWITATEINNDFFTVERSANGTEFSELTRVDGAGNSENILKYQVIDPLPLIGTGYYRIKQTDFDGKFTYSDIEAVVYQPEFDLKVYPSPVVLGNNVNIRYNFEATVNLEVFDSSGKIITSLEADGANGGQEFKFSTRGLAAGVYTVTATSGDYSTQKSFVITN